jgi:hypothetical protein
VVWWISSISCELHLIAWSLGSQQGPTRLQLLVVCSDLLKAWRKLLWNGPILMYLMAQLLSERACPSHFMLATWHPLGTSIWSLCRYVQWSNPCTESTPWPAPAWAKHFGPSESHLNCTCRHILQHCTHHSTWHCPLPNHPTRVSAQWFHVVRLIVINRPSRS